MSLRLQTDLRAVSRAFTLTELLAVIAIIGVLAAIIIPIVSKVRASAWRTACMSNLRQVGLGVNLYVNDNKGRLPGGLNEGQSGWYKNPSQNDGELASYIAGYLSQPLWTGGTSLRSDFFICPAWSSQNEPDRTKKPYAMNMSVSLDDGSTFVEPFGRASNSLKKPILLTQLSARLATIPMMFELDNLNVHQTGQTNVVWAPPHYSTRNILYFDGRVQAENVN